MKQAIDARPQSLTFPGEAPRYPLPVACCFVPYSERECGPVPSHLISQRGIPSVCTVMRRSSSLDVACKRASHCDRSPRTYKLLESNHTPNSCPRLSHSCVSNIGSPHLLIKQHVSVAVRLVSLSGVPCVFSTISCLSSSNLHKSPPFHSTDKDSLYGKLPTNCC